MVKVQQTRLSHDIEDMYFLLEYFVPLESKETLRRRIFRLEGKRKSQPCLQNDAKRVAKKKKTYTPTQSPPHSSSNREPLVKHQVIHLLNTLIFHYAF